MDPIQIESPVAQINRARFAGKDFFTFVDDIVARIQILYVTEFNDFVVSGTGQMLIDIVSWACEGLSFYIDRQASESYLSTARTRKGVNRLCRQIGYKMAGTVGASVDLSVTLKVAMPFDVTIPVGFKFKGPSELVFEAVESVTFPSGEGPLSPPRTVSCREGVTRTEVFTSTGAKNQVFRLSPGNNLSVTDGTVSVRVAGPEWTITDLITFDQTNQVEIDFNTDPTTVRFGDGVAGNIPPAASSIVVTYAASSGKGGLVLNGAITDVVTPLVVSFQAVGLVITNPLPSSGGADAEDIASAKAKAPRYFKARNVAITQPDYVGLSQAFADPIAGAVSVAQAFVARGADDDLTLQGLLLNVRSIVEPLATDVSALVASAEANRVSAESSRSSISTAMTSAIESKLDTIVTNPQLPGATGGAIDARTAAQDIRVISNAANVRASEGLAAGSLGLKDAALTDIKTQLANVESRVQQIVTSVGSIEQAVTDANVGTVTIANALSAQASALSTQGTTLTSITTRVTTAFEASVNDQLDAIFEHVDGFLSDDCKANLVQVPILTRDVNGFLTAPPIALMRSLESYLTDRKEVTQVVEVVSGAVYLVAAEILGTIGILQGYVQATVLSNVRKALDDLLRVRPFGKSLRISDLIAVTVPNPTTGQKGVDGVDYAVFRIVGPSGAVDVDGNLVIPRKQVVTKGSVILTGQVAIS